MFRIAMAFCFLFNGVWFAVLWYRGDQPTFFVWLFAIFACITGILNEIEGLMKSEAH